VFEKHMGDPELVVEVLSPASRRVDRLLKCARYAEGGIGQYWIADPGDGGRPPSVQVYYLVDGEYRLTGEASGQQSLSVPGPVPVTINPAEVAVG
jgi:Uma2 family endonuclease